MKVTARDLRKLGIAYKRARYFITCNGCYGGAGVAFTPDALRAQLAAPIQGGRHGRRATRQCEGQLSLFDAVDTPEKRKGCRSAGQQLGAAGGEAAALPQSSRQEPQDAGRAACATPEELFAA